MHWKSTIPSSSVFSTAFSSAVLQCALIRNAHHFKKSIDQGVDDSKKKKIITTALKKIIQK